MKRKSGWVETQKLTVDDGATGDRFGYSVAMDGDRAVISSPFDDDQGNNSGSIYIFEKRKGVWVKTSKLTAKDGRPGDHLGLSVETDGQRVIASAQRSNARGKKLGAGYIFERVDGTWLQAAKLLASEGAASDSFGGAVTISGDIAAMGATGNDDRSGAVYVFCRNGSTWLESAKLLPSDSGAGDGFGWQLRLDGTTLLIGVYHDNERGTKSGSGYFFNIAVTPDGRGDK